MTVGPYTVGADTPTGATARVDAPQPARDEFFEVIPNRRRSSAFSPGPR